MASWSESFPVVDASGEITTSGQLTADFITDTNTADGDWTTTTVQPDGTYTVQAYTDGRMTSATSNGSNGTQLSSTTVTYDASGRQATVTDSRTGTSTLAYYANDALKSSTDPGSRVTEYFYDSMGRQTEVILPDDSTTTTVYNPKGQVIKAYGSQQNPTESTYDFAGRPATMTTWQVFDQATGTGTSGASVTTWIYDSQRGWLDRKQYNDTKGTDYTYTAAGRLASRTWARGVVTTYGYDSAGQLSSTDYSDTTPDITVTYDRLGRQVTQSNGVATSAFAYNSGNLAIDTETISYDFDTDGTADFTRVLDRSQDNLLRDSGWKFGTVAQYNAEWVDGNEDPDRENAASYTYGTADGRLAAIGNGSDIFSYSYLANSNLISTVTVTDPADTVIFTVTNLWETTRDALSLKKNEVGTAVSQYGYGVNAIGQREDLALSGSAFGGSSDIVWGYDSLGQVISADSTITGLDRGYRYDMIGNRLKSADGTTNPDDPSATAYTPDANLLNQYSVINDQSIIINPQYDFDGNMTEGPLPAQSGLSDLFWDAENRLISATLPDNTNVSYRYDAQSRRIAEWGDGLDPASSPPTIVYVYDGWNPIAEYGASYAQNKTYTWGMDLSGTMQGAGGVGGLLSVTDGTGTYFPTYDGNGNVSEYLDSSGTVVAHYEYDPFGRITVASELKAEDFTHRFSTKPLDPTTGLYYYGYRYYDPETGRWPSRDLLGEWGGSNLYGFVGNSGVNRWDYVGLIQWDAAKATGNTGPLNDGSGEDLFELILKTDAGNEITGGILGKTVSNKFTPNNKYFCHGYTFGGDAKYKNFYVSILGDHVPTVLADEWTEIPCAKAESDHIAIFYKGGKVEHSGIFSTVETKIDADGKTIIDEDLSKLNGKHGSASALVINTTLKNDTKYGKYKCYAKKEAKQDACTGCASQEICMLSP